MDWTPSSAAGMRFSLVGTTCVLGSGMSNAMVTNALHFGPLLVEGADTRRTRHAAEVASPQELVHALAPE